MLRVTVKELWDRVEDSVLYILVRIEVDIIEYAYFLIEFIEGAIKLVLFAERVGANEIKVTGLALNKS